MSVRVRFAPSPTGYLHVGSARTALLSWIFARKYQGTFILRIEDTDRERSSENMVAGILEAMAWLGLNWDEGPHYQSHRLQTYRAAAERLVATQHAYHCFCPPDLLEQKRKESAARKSAWVYDRTCLGLSDEEVGRRLHRGETAAIRFRVREGHVVFEDTVFGEIVLENKNIEDFVLLRSDGQPTYHLSVVVDDADMRISHVIRGADHLSNTPKQILLYEAMGVGVPQFAHLPLILGPDKSRLSKRHGTISVMAYKEQGILPEAFRNFLALLGWSPGTNQELFGGQELIDAFSVDGISRTNVVFNYDKLLWFNSEHIKRMPIPSLARRLKDLARSDGVWRDSFEGSEQPWFEALIELLRPRAKSLSDFVRDIRIYLLPDVEYNLVAVERFFGEPKLEAYLPMLASRLERLKDFAAARAEVTLRELAVEFSVKAGVLINASRVALTGQAVAPGLFDVMAVLGKEKTVRRLRRAAGFLASRARDSRGNGATGR